MFGQPAGFGGFGQSQPQQAASPFGATPASNPFGAPAFGQPQQQAPAFGAGGGLFGQASAPAFGAASAPAFGAAQGFGAQQPRPAFGGAFGAAPAFGASQPAFGATSAPAFGMQQSQPAFGASPAPAFGMGASSPAFGAASAPAFGAASAPAFGAANPFGGSTFGASSPAFGAASAPAFGMGGGAPAFGAASAASPFGGGSSIFGAAAASPGAFGASQPAQQGGLMFGAAGGGGAFGMQQQQQQVAVGTRSAPYQKTLEKESTAAGQSGVANYITITAMPAYQGKSQEELRFEDYSQGVKSAAAGPPQQQAGGGLFGGGAGAFGQQQQQQPNAFGAGGFGQSAPAFGAPQQAGPFGSPGSAPAFGAASAAGFGFGQSAPAFGAASAPAFGAFGASSAAFGQTQAAGSIFGTTPSFASSPSIFGGGSAPAFGQQASSSSIFSFNTAPSMFSSQSAPATQPSPFGPPAASNPFGTSTLSPFGQSSAAAGGSLFAPSSTSAFGGGGFGAAKPAFAFPSASAPGGSFASFSFSSAAASSPGLFGSMTTSTFPASAPAAGAFNFASSPGLFNSPAPGGFQLPGANQALAMAQGPPPSVGQAPYGAFPALPAVSEPKVGISARPISKGVAAAGGMGSGAGALRNSPLLSLRSAGAMHRVGVQVRSTGATPLALISATPAPTPATTMADGTPSGLSSGGGGGTSAGAAPGSGALMLPARANPHRLFIREPPPGTEAAATTSSVLTPLRSPQPAGDGGTPDRAANGDAYHSGGQGHHTHSNHHGNHHGSGGGRGTPMGAGTPANGGAASVGGDDGDAVLPRLGRLAAEGYSYEPSAVQLQAMYSADPSSLRNVSNFTVSRRGFGQIRWLHPVDVTGLALNRIVTIGEGEVYCYADEDKPPVGQGLNVDAEVTLYNVYKLDPATRQPIRSGPAVLRWERQLRSMCVKMGARFVSYRADGGVWKFEVEHFSRYGLLDLEDDEEELEELPAPTGAAAGKVPIARFGLVPGDATEDSQGMSDEERDGWLTLPGPSNRQDLPTYMEGDEASPEAEGEDQEQEEAAGAAGGAAQLVVFGVAAAGLGREAAAAAAGAVGPALQHSLPAQLNLDPSGLMAMQGSLFGERVEVPTSGLGASGTAAAQARPQPSAQHVWTRGRTPLTTSSSGTRALLSKEPASPAIGPMGGTRTSAAGPDAGALTPGPPLGTAASAAATAGARTPASASRSPGAAAAAAAAAGAASMCFTDAGLCLGPSFRVGWGPGGKLVYPGNVGQCQAVHVRRVLVEGSVADGSAPSGVLPSSDSASSSIAATGPSASEAQLAAVRQRMVAALEVHLRYSSPDVPPLSLDAPAAPAADAAAAAAVVPMEEGGTAPAVAGETAATAAESVPRWSLLCDRRSLPRLIESYLHSPEADVTQLSSQHQQQQQGAAEGGNARTLGAAAAGAANATAAAAGGGASGAGGGSTELLLLRRHEAETWKLIQALWEHIDGEDDGLGGADGGGGTSGGGYGEGGGGGSSLGSLDMFAGRSTLAAFRRRRAVGQWLRRQAKPLVERELAAVSSPAEATLRLAAAGQTAAAAAVAVAAGDVRLATLLAQAGYGARGEVQAEMEEQLAVWERSDMLRLIAPDRLLMYRLLAGQVDDVRDRLALDWRRYLGLLLAYATPATASPAAAVTHFSTAIATDRAAPRPVPLYADERATLGRCRPRDSHSPSARDLHYELLCLWAEQQQYAAAAGGQYGGTAAAAHAEPPAGADVLSALLQPGSYSANPLDSGLAWHLMTLLQALGALPGSGTTAPAAAAAVAEDSDDWQAVRERNAALLAVQVNLLAQLQLLGGTAEWQVYVALHTPDLGSWPGLRSHLVGELLTLNCPEWLGNDAKTRFLTQTLGVPQALLAEAEATWARYQGDDERQCAALLSSGATRAAHDLLISTVAPALFLAGHAPRLAALLRQLEAASPPVPTAEWECGGGLYSSYLALFGDGGSVGSVGGVDDAAVGALLGRLQSAGDRLSAATMAAAGGGPDAAPRQQQLRQQLAYSRMAAKLHQLVMGTAPATAATAAASSLGGAQAAAVRKLASMQGVLGLHDSCLSSELRMAGIATAAAAVTAAAAGAL